MEEIKIDNFWQDNVIANVTQTFDSWVKDEENLDNAKFQIVDCLQQAIGLREVASWDAGKFLLENKIARDLLDDYVKLEDNYLAGDEVTEWLKEECTPQKLYATHPSEDSKKIGILQNQIVEYYSEEIDLFSYEKFAVNGWFGADLVRKGEIVINYVYDFNAVWIRQQGNQKCVDDYVIKELHKDYLRWLNRSIKGE